MSPIDSGSEPTSLLELTSKTVNWFINPISDGKQPVNPIFVRIISSRFPAIFVKLEGKQLLKLLFANTMTETGDLPKFLGMDDWNLLLLMKSASRFLSKSLEGILPLNSLYLISRNLSEGRESTTEGNLPLNWLLLTSSS